MRPDSRSPANDDSGRAASPWGRVAVVLLIGLFLVRNGQAGSSAPPQPSHDAHTATVGVDDRPSELTDEGAPLPLSRGERIRIPVIGVDAPMTEVGLDADGLIEAPPPEDSNRAGWFTQSVTPGELGTSVIVGHVDNKAGPAVFYGLGSLRRAQHIEVAREDGQTAVFVIDGIEVFPKDNFPSGRVYDSTGRAELRVITCGGPYSPDSGYGANIVVFAHLTRTTSY